MADAFIYDHVRTPRGRGKADGSLHEVPAVQLAATTLKALRDRNGLDTKLVDDIILGCVDPIVCNPIMQAKVLNEANTDLNIVMGLCLGHDIIFAKHSEAPSTTFMVKDEKYNNCPGKGLK